jgi:hypothetical protein
MVVAGDVHVEDVSQDFQAISGNRRGNNCAMFVDHHEVSSGVDATLHHDDVSIGRQDIDVTICDNVSDGHALGVPCKQSAHEIGPPNGNWATFEIQCSIEDFNRCGLKLDWMKEHLSNTGKVDPDLIRAQKVGGGDRHIMSS